MVFHRLPWQEKGYRRFWIGGLLLRLLSVLTLLGAVGGAVQAIRLTRPAVWLVLALISLTMNRMAAKASGALRDALVWKILSEDYQPMETAWSDKQQALLPSRLLPFAVPLSSSVDPDNCIRLKIRCSCEGEQFRVCRHPEQGFLVATCVSCGREIVLFDEHLDSHRADGQAQRFPVKELQMAVCRSCGGEAHRVILTVASDEQRSFFQAEMDSDGAESGYCLVFQMFCAACGASSGDGTYFWSKEWEQEADTR